MRKQPTVKEYKSLKAEANKIIEHHFRILVDNFRRENPCTERNVQLGLLIWTELSARLLSIARLLVIKANPGNEDESEQKLIENFQAMSGIYLAELKEHLTENK